MEASTREATKLTEKSPKVLLESRGQSIVGQGSGGETSDDTCEVEIPDDDLVVQILARLDGPSYREALYQDARSINDNFLVPPHFPWHQSKRNVPPHKIMKSIPRDIDDLHAITLCQDDLHAPFGDFQGPFGFGRYENGHARGNYSSNLLAIPNGGAFAAARRSYDPGIIELFTQIPLPSSTDARTKSKDPDYTKLLSHLPCNWGKRGKCLHPVSQQMDNPAKLAKSDFKSQNFADNRSRSRTQLELAKSFRRLWKISTKVGGVSSRSTLFPPSTGVINTDCDQRPEITRRKVPMLCLASLSPSVKYGTTVSMKKLEEMDNSGFARNLGSYDCRFTNALLDSRRDSDNRVKRIEVGRTRLVWSNLIQGDEPFLPSTRNRSNSNYNCLITGQRLDGAKCKRPTEIKVGVRLNERLVMEEVEAITETSNGRKRKHSTRQAVNQGPQQTAFQCPESRTDEELDTVLHSHLHVQPQNNRFIEQGTKNGSVVYLEIGAKSSSHSIDRDTIIATLLKFNQKKSYQKKSKRGASSDANSAGAVHTFFEGSQVIKQCNAPRFACVPLEDGQLRTVCLTAGNMVGTPVHNVICEASQHDTGRRCSVCWSDEGFEKEGVQECIKCGLLAHPSCCFSKGSFSENSTDHPLGPEDTSQDKLKNINGAAMHSNTKAQVDTIDYFDKQNMHWQCAVCCHFTERKPRRNPRIPSRFADGETFASSNNTRDHDDMNKHVNIPGPQCSLCPHRGGAMSLLESSDDSDQPPGWAHEVCRIWSGLNAYDKSKMKETSSLCQKFPNRSPLTHVCALCGTGALKDNTSMELNAGLTRCAAEGCHVVFHPMCALLALLSSKTCNAKGGKAKPVRTRKTRHAEQQVKEEKRYIIHENIEADKKLCKEYTLKLVQLTRTEQGVGSACKENKMTIIPVAFCGIHNHQRKDCFYGCLPGGAAI